MYSQTLGYPRAADDAARALLDALEHGSVRRVGVGMADDRPFLFCAGIGFDAAVIRRVERHSRRVKRLASHPLHIAAAFHTFFSADGRRTHVRIEIDGGEVLNDIRFAIVSKCDAVHVSRPAPAQHRPQRQPRHAPLAHRVHRPDARSRCSAARRRRSGPASSSRAARTSSTSTISAGLHVHCRDAVPVSGRRRRRRRHERAGHRVRPGRTHRCRPDRKGDRDRTVGSARYRGQHDVGHVRDDDVDAGRGERARVVGIVDGPHADEHAGVVRGADAVGTGRRAPTRRRD